MKEYHLQVPGNHKLTLKCLCQLRKRVAKDDITLKQYDEATHLGDGIIQLKAQRVVQHTCQIVK